MVREIDKFSGWLLEVSIVTYINAYTHSGSCRKIVTWTERSTDRLRRTFIILE